MQPLVVPPREDLTEALVLELLTGDGVGVAAGLDLLDETAQVVLDLTDALVEGEVSRSNYADVHGTCHLAVTSDLDWGRARVRPYLTLSKITGYTALPHIHYLPETYEAFAAASMPAGYWPLWDAEGTQFADISGHDRAATRPATATLLNGPVSEFGSGQASGATVMDVPDTGHGITIVFWIREDGSLPSPRCFRRFPATRGVA